MRYNKRPSEILNIDDSYVAFCLDEAIDEFISRLENKERPRFNQDKENGIVTNPGLQYLLSN